MSDTTPLIRIEQFTQRSVPSARTEIESFGLKLEPGATLTVLGEAGSGKDAVVRLLTGATQRGADLSGTIQFRMGSPQAIARRVTMDLRTAFLPGPHSSVLNPNASVALQLSLAIARKLHQPQSSGRVELLQALERLPGAPAIDALDHPPALVAPEILVTGLLAAAMAQTPELLIADDPLGELSPAHARALATALKSEQKRLGFAILYSAATADAARLLGGDVIVLRSGRIVETGAVSRLATAQSHVYTQTLFRAVSAIGAPPPARAPARGEPLLRAQGAQLEGQAPRDALNFELRRGASLALVGEIGSGRRALVRALLGLEKIAAGRVVFDQVDIGVLSSGMMARLRRRVAFITGEDDALDPRMTIFDTVSEPLRAHLTMPRDLMAHNRDAALKRVGLAALRGGTRVASLSPFDRRRLQIARAIVSAPLLAVIDEPLRGLDAFAQSVIRDLLRNFRSNEGSALMVITSDFGLAQAFCEDVFVFKDGRIVERGPIATMLAKPVDPHTRKLIDAVSAAPAAIPEVSLMKQDAAAAAPVITPDAPKPDVVVSVELPRIEAEELKAGAKTEPLVSPEEKKTLEALLEVPELPAPEGDSAPQ